MSLNIKNEAVHDLVRRAAAQTGKSQTSVVEEALRLYLDELDRQQDYDAADEILRHMQERLAALGEPSMRIEDLYDPETGLPA